MYELFSHHNRREERNNSAEASIFVDFYDKKLREVLSDRFQFTQKVERNSIFFSKNQRKNNSVWKKKKKKISETVVMEDTRRIFSTTFHMNTSDNNLRYCVISPSMLNRLGADVEKTDIWIDSELETFQFSVRGKP